MSGIGLERRAVAAPAALFCCLLWGSAFPTVKAGLAFFPPVFFAGVRFLAAGLLILALGAAAGLLRRPTPAALRLILLIGLLQTAFGYYFFFKGMSRASASSGAIVNSSGPLVTALMASLLLGERGWTPSRIAGVGLGLAGLVTAFADSSGFGFHLLGEGFILLSVLFHAYSSILAKRLASTVDPFLLAGGSMSSGGGLLLLGSLLWEDAATGVITATAASLLAYSIVISATAFTLWYALLRYHPVGEISLAKFSIPVFGYLLAVLTLGEPLTRNRSLGVLLVAAGIVLVFRGGATVVP